MNSAADPPLGLAFGRFRVLPERRELLADGRPVKQARVASPTGNTGRKRISAMRLLVVK